MELKEITTTYSRVRVGDVMFRGTVKRVGSPNRTRSGGLLMTIEYEDGTSLVKEPETVCTLKRPVE